MKRLLLLLVLFSMPAAHAVQHTFSLGWDAYSVPNATMHGTCQLPTDKDPVEVGKVAASATSLTFVKDVPMGVSMSCDVYAELNGVVSQRSAPAIYVEPVVLPPVTGCILQKQ